MAKIEKEITPDRYRCLLGECPAAFKLDDGRILLIGKKADPFLLNQISGRVGADEYVVVVEPGLLENVSLK
jgi:hypothetical protein